MKVPVIPVNAAPASNKPVTEMASADMQQFTRLLDEKKKSAASRSQPAAGGLPQVKSKPADQRVKSPAAVQTDDATGANAGSTDPSVLALLNQCHACSPPDDLTDKEKLLGEDSDPQPDPIQAGTVVPAATMKTPEPALQLADSLSTTDIQSVTPDAAAAIPTPEKGIKDAGQYAAPSEFTLTDSSGIKPAVSRAAAQTAVTQPELPATTQSLPLSEITGLKAGTLQTGNDLLPLKQNTRSEGEIQSGLQPEFTLTTPAVSSSASDTAATQTPATGVLTQEMGTPAWQQSLGQQIACFTRNGIQHAELRLHPAELGSLQISLQLKNEQAQLHFVSASHQVREAIEAAVPHLRISLAESGIELGQSSVGTDSSQGWKDPGQSGQSSRQNFAHPQSSDNHVASEEPVQIALSTVGNSNGINTFA